MSLSPIASNWKTSSVKVSPFFGNPSYMLLFTKHSHRYCHSRSKSTRMESVSNNTTYDILRISVSGLYQITFQLLCFCRQERKLLNDLVQIGQSCVITGKHLPTFQCFKHCPSPCSLVGNGQLKAEMLQPFMSLVLVFINSLAKVEMVWGVLKVVSGMSLLFSCHYALLSTNICMTIQSTL